MLPPRQQAGVEGEPTLNGAIANLLKPERRGSLQREAIAVEDPYKRLRCHDLALRLKVLNHLFINASTPFAVSWHHTSLRESES